MAEFTDEELIRYCESHCKTERALFHRKHVLRMIELSRLPYNLPAGIEWWALHGDMERMCEAARARTSRPTPVVPINVPNYLEVSTFDGYGTKVKYYPEHSFNTVLRERLNSALKALAQAPQLPSGTVCKGALSLGTGCGLCERCRLEYADW